MKKFKIDNISYDVVTSWDDIKIKKFLEIRDHEKKADKIGLFEYNLEFLSIVSDIDTDELKKIPPTKVSELLQELLSVTSNDIRMIDEPIIKINGITYAMDKNIDKMQIGQFIDLDLVMKEGDVWDNAHKLCASFIRRVENNPIDKLKIFFKKNIFRKKITCNDYRLKKYSYDDLLNTSKIFYRELPMPYIYTCVTFFFNFRSNLTTKYEGLFPSTGREPNEIDPNEPKTPQQEFAEKWSWYGIIRELCKGDLTRFEEMTELNLIQVLNDLSFQKEKVDLEKYIANNTGKIKN